MIREQHPPTTALTPIGFTDDAAVERLRAALAARGVNADRGGGSHERGSVWVMNDLFFVRISKRDLDRYPISPPPGFKVVKVRAGGRVNKGFVKGGPGLTKRAADVMVRMLRELEPRLVTTPTPRGKRRKPLLRPLGLS